MPFRFVIKIYTKGDIFYFYFFTYLSVLSGGCIALALICNFHIIFLLHWYKNVTSVKVHETPSRDFMCWDVIVDVTTYLLSE